MIDVKITQGKYWNGSQFSYGLYKFLVAFPLTGALGLDHFALRSPITGILKCITLVPLLGFWYFYDIAQAFGEEELVQKYGLSIPLYGPIGIGAEMFHNNITKPSPKEAPRPWLFILYIITTCLFVIFPINKLVIGDFAGALIQFIYFITIILAPVALVWGIIDIYRGIFDTRSLLEKGGYHMFPSNFHGKYSDRSVLGPLQAEPIPAIISEDVKFAALLGPQAAATELVAELAGVDPALRPVAGLKKIPEKIIKQTLDPLMARMPVDKLKELQKDPIPALEKELYNTTKDSLTSLIPSIPDPTVAAANARKAATLQGAVALDAATKGVTDAASLGAQATKDVAILGAQAKDAASLGAQATKGVADVGAHATKDISSGLVTKVTPSPVKKGLTSLRNPIKHVGGGSEDDTPTAFALFTTGILAFSGYVFYMFRNKYKPPERSDDPPSDPRTIRIPSETI
jgi:hypothetical protein